MDFTEIMKKHDPVKIIRLLVPARPYEGTDGAKRAPQVGDTGTIVQMYAVAGKAVGYVVENIDSEGHTVWLADFLPEEIQVRN